MKLSKNIRNFGWVVLPQTRSISIHNVEKLFRLKVMQLFQKHSSWWLGRAPQHPLSRPSSFYGVKQSFFSWCYADFQQRSNERLVVLPQTRSSSIHGVESTFRPDGVKLFTNIQSLGWVVLPQTRPSSFHGVEEPFRVDVMQPFQNHSSWWLGRAPQHPLSRPSLFRGVKLCFRFDVMQTFNSVQMNGWSWSPKHGPAQITLLSQLIARMAWNFSKTFEILDGSCSPKHGPVLFTVLKNFSSGCYANISKTFKLMAGPRSPTSPVTAQLVSRRRKFFSFWCCADFQQRSNERLVVLSQTRSSSFYGVESIFRPDGIKHFKNIRIFAWIVLPQTRPISIHGVTEPFGLSVMQPFQKHLSWWLGRAPQHPLSRPSSLRGVKHEYRFDIMQTFNNVQMNGWSCSPKHGPAQFTLISQLFVRTAWSFSKTFNT